METKPGVTTTEFWITIFGNVIGVINLFDWWNYVPDRWAVIFMAILNAAYAVSRGQAKSRVPFDAERYSASLVPRRKQP